MTVGVRIVGCRAGWTQIPGYFLRAAVHCGGDKNDHQRFGAAMKLSVPKRLAACAALVAAAVPLFASPAHAIHRVESLPDCMMRDDFLSIEYFVKGTRAPVDGFCFADDGIMEVTIYGVHNIRSGNNRVVISYVRDQGGTPDTMILDKWQQWTDERDPIHKVILIAILPE